MWHASGRITISLNVRPRLEDYDLSGTRKRCPYGIKRGTIYLTLLRKNLNRRVMATKDSRSTYFLIKVTIQVGAPNWHNHRVVTVQECSILAHFGLRSILVLFEKA